MIALVVRFYPKEGQKQEFKNALFDLVDTMSKESTFVNAIVHEDLAEPGVLVIYEIWRETRESFLENQYLKGYRVPFEALVNEALHGRQIEWLVPEKERGSELTVT